MEPQDNWPREAGRAAWRSLALVGLLGLAGCNSTPSGVFQPKQGVIAMRLGGNHTCVTLYANGMRCWGANAEGQLGNNTTTASSSPVEPIAWGSGPGNLPYPGGGKVIVDFATGGAHTCAIDGGSGRAYCWGSDGAGQLGSGASRPNHVVAQPVKQYHNFSVQRVNALAAAAEQTCGLFGGGNIGCWGWGYESVPVQIPGFVQPVQVATGGKQACVLEGSGTVKCWSQTMRLSSAVSWQSNKPTPRAVVGLTAKKVTVGDRHACAIDQSDQVRCWGSNVFGQLGNGNRSATTALSTVSIGGVPIIATDISAGEGHTCAMTAAGSVLCWGHNYAGQTGDPTNVFSVTPYTIVSSGAVAVAAGGAHSCSRYWVGDIARMQCWGANNAGQLGRPNTLQSSTTPLEVPGLP